MQIFHIFYPVFFVIFMLLWQNTTELKYKIVLLNLGFFIFYIAFLPLAGVYLLFCTLLIWLYERYKKPTYTIISFLVLALAFWKVYEVLPREERFSSIYIPLGISYFTFQAVSYVIESKKHNYQWSFWRILAFVGFFPTIVSGPIQRANVWIEEVSASHLKTIDYAAAFSYILLGLFYKLIFSSYLDPLVSEVWSSPEENSAGMSIMGLYAYTFQLFTDFAGYSFIIFGLCALLGIDCGVNFKTPYLARNIQEFWKRWHISLSSWFRDYFYITLLGGKANKATIQFRNTFLVMIVCALWHGAAIHYVVWGLWHGFFIFLEQRFQLMKKLNNRWLEIFITFHIVALGWLLFRAPSIDHWWQYVVSFTQPWNTDYIKENITFVYLMVGALIFVIFEDKIRTGLYKVLRWIELKQFSVIFPLVLAALVAFIMRWSPSGIPTFIYASF